MTTIPRHPVPTDSYDAKRPLNDLLIVQFEHFKHIAASLPADLRAGIPPVPPIEDSEATGRFIAAVTRALVSRKKELPRLLPKPAPKSAARPARPKLPGTLSLAAVADDTPARPKKRGKKSEKKTIKKNATKTTKKSAKKSSTKTAKQKKPAQKSKSRRK